MFKNLFQSLQGKPAIKPEAQTQPAVSVTKERVSVAATSQVPSQEIQPGRVINIIYRDNDAYASLVPEITRNLIALEYEVRTQVFPRGTKEEIIGKWVVENIDNLRGHKIMSDATLMRGIGTVLHTIAPDALRDLGYDAEDGRHEAELDNIVQNIATKTILGDNWEFDGMAYVPNEEQQGNKEVHKESIIKLLKNILQNSEQIPKKVYLIAERLTDHKPFRPEYGTSKTPEMKENAVKTLRQWLIEAGISGDTIEIVDSTRNLENDADGVGNWIIVDRHNQYKTTQDGKSRKAVVLHMPVESLLKTAQEQGLLKINLDTQQDATGEVIKQKYSL